MFAALVPVGFGLVFLALLATQGRGWDVRRALLHAGLLTWSFVVLSTELLGAVRALTLPCLALVWVGFAATAAAVAWRHRSGLRWSPPSLTRAEAASLACVGLLVVTLAILALVCPPNTNDSLKYHVARIPQWLQRQTLGLHPTHLPDMLTRHGGLTYGGLHLYAFAGGDRLLGLVQWSCMLGSLIGCSRIAAQLGADMRGQVLTVLATASLPMGVLQATSTTVDYGLSFFLVCLVTCLLDWRRRPTGRGELAVAAALGLAVATKELAVFFAPAFIAWLAFRGGRWRAALRLAAIAFVVGLVLNAGNVTRRVQLTAEGAHSTSTVRALNAHPGLSLWASNVLRNLCCHYPSSQPLRPEAVTRAVYALHASVGLDANDPDSTFRATGCEFRILSDPCGEDSAPNPLHLLLIFVSAGFVLFRRRHLGLPNRLVPYLWALTCGALLFCFARWQPWNSRLHLPLFVLATPLIGVCLVAALQRIALPFGIGLLFCAFPQILWNSSKPMLLQPRSYHNVLTLRTSYQTVFEASRPGLYLQNTDNRYLELLDATQFLAERRCARIGVGPGIGLLYALRALLDHALGERSRVRPVLVENATRDLPEPDPFAVQAVVLAGEHPEAVTVDGQRFVLAYERRWVAVYLPEE